MKDMTYDNIKNHKKIGFHPLFRIYIFGKTAAFLELIKADNSPISRSFLGHFVYVILLIDILAF